MLDAGLALVLVLFFVRGLLRGMIRELAGLVGVVLGIFCAGKFYQALTPHIKTFISSTDWSGIVAWISIFAAVLVLVTIVAVLLRKFMNLTFTAWLDHVLGAATGAAKGVLLCAIGLAVLERLVPEPLFLKSSILAGYIEQLTAVVRAHLPAFL